MNRNLSGYKTALGLMGILCLCRVFNYKLVYLHTDLCKVIFIMYFVSELSLLEFNYQFYCCGLLIIVGIFKLYPLYW